MRFVETFQLHIQRRKVRCSHIEQLLKAINHKVGLLIAIDVVAGAHAAEHVKCNALGLSAFNGVYQLAGRAQNACAVSPQAIFLLHQAKFNRVPVQPRQLLASSQAVGLQPTRTIGLHVVGKHRVKQQRYMTEQIMENIRLDNVVKLLRLADPVGDGKFAIGQQRKKWHLRYQPRHCHYLPAGGFDQTLIDIVKAWDVAGCAQRRQGGDELVAGQASQQGRLPRIQTAIGLVVSGRVSSKVLRAGVVQGHLPAACVISARRTRGLAVNGGQRRRCIYDYFSHWPSIF